MPSSTLSLTRKWDIKSVLLRRLHAESFEKNVACPLESVDASYPNNLSTQGDISPELERQTYSEKRRFWEDITKKRESYQRSESEVSRASQLTVGESDSEYLQSIISEGEDIEEMPERSETLEDLNIPDISECTVAEKAHYFEEQIQKESSATASKPLSKMTSQESFKEKRKSSIDTSEVVEMTEEIKTTKVEYVVEKNDEKMLRIDDVKIEEEKKKEIQTTQVPSEIDILIPREMSEVKTPTIALKSSEPEVGEVAEGEKKDKLSEKKELEVLGIETGTIDYRKNQTICSEFIASESKFSQEEIKSVSEMKKVKEVSDSGVSSKQEAPSMIPVKTKLDQSSKFELKKDDKEIKKEVKEVRKGKKEIKKEVKEIKKEEKEIKKDVKEVNKDVKEVKKDVKEVKKDVKEVKKEEKEIKKAEKEIKKEEKKDIKKEEKEVKTEVKEIKKEEKEIKIEVEEIKKEKKEVKTEVKEIKKEVKKEEIKKEVKKEGIKKEVKKEEIKKEAKDMRPKEIPGLKRELSDLSKKDSKIPLLKREPSDVSDKNLSKKETKVIDKPEPKKETTEGKQKVPPTKQESPSTSKKESKTIPVVSSPPSLKREPSDLSKKDSKIPVLKREPSDLTKKESPIPGAASPKDIPEMKREPSDLSKKDSKIPMFKQEPSDLSDKKLSKEETKVSVSSPKQVEKIEIKKEIQVSVSSSGQVEKFETMKEHTAVEIKQEIPPIEEKDSELLKKDSKTEVPSSPPDTPGLRREPSELSKKESKIPIFKREPSDLSEKELSKKDLKSPLLKQEPSDSSKKDAKTPISSSVQEMTGLQKEHVELSKKESATIPASSVVPTPQEIPQGLKREPSDLSKKDSKIPVLKREPSDLTKKESTSPGVTSPKEMPGMKREPSELSKKDSKIHIFKREPSDLTKKESTTPGVASPKEFMPELKREPSDLSKKDSKIPLLKREPSDLTKKESTTSSSPSSPKAMPGIKREPSDLTKKDTKIPVLKREPSDLTKKESGSGPTSPKEIFGIKREPSDLTKRDTKIPVFKREPSDLAKKEPASGSSSPKEIFGLKREPSDLTKKDTKIPVLKREPSDLTKQQSGSGPTSPKEIFGIKREPSDLTKKDTKIPVLKREPSDLTKKESTSGPSSPKDIRGLKREPSDLSKKESKIPTFKRESSDLSKKDSKIPSLKREPSDVSKKDSKIPSMKREGSDLSKKDSKIPSLKREPSDLSKKDSKIPSMKREGSDLSKKDSKIPTLKREPSDLTKKDSKIPSMKREGSDLTKKDSKIPSMKREPSDLSKKDSKIPVLKREASDLSDKDSSSKESKIPSRRESLTKSDKDKQTKQKAESKIPKMKFGESGPSKSLDKSGKNGISTTKVTEKVSEHVETRMLETKSQSQTITKTFTDPVEALKEFEAMERMFDAAPGVVTSKIDHTESKTLEKKEQKLSEISQGDDKVLKFEEKDQKLKEKSSESTSKIQTDDVTLEDKFSTSKKTDKNEVQNISVLVSGDKQFIDVSATQSMSLIKDQTRTQLRDNEDGILVQETGSSLLKDRKIDTALSMEKDSSNLTKKKDIDMFDLGRSLQDELKAAVVGEQSYEESSERNETKIFPSRETSSQEYSETLEEHQQRALGEHEARNIAENLVQQIEEEIVKRSESTDGLSQTLIIGKSSVEKINDKINIEADDFDEQLADDLAEKFENIMGKRKESQAQVIESVEQIRLSLLGNKDLSENSNRESLSISDDLTKDEESFPSSSPLGSERQDVPSKFQVEISRDPSLLELTKDKISPIHFEAYESTGARVLEIIEPQDNLSTRQDSIDVSSIEIDDPRNFRDDDDDEDLSLGDRYLRENEFGRLHESPAMSSLDKIGQDRDLTFSPSTMSESSLVHDLRSLSPTIQSSKILPELAESDDAGFSSMEPEKTPEKLANLNTQIIDINIIPSIISPKIKVTELEIKTIDWTIGNEKIAINENIEPSLAFDKELDDYQSSIIMQQSMTSSHDESATRSSEDISTIDSVKESDYYGIAGKSSNIINIIPPSELEIEHELVEDKLDISCQELVAALQREHEAKTPTDEKIPVTPRKLSESDSELELVEQSLENVKKVQILPSSFDEKLTEVSEIMFDSPKNISYMQNLTSIPTIEETLAEKPIKEKSEKEEKEIDTKDDKIKKGDELLSNEKERVSSPLNLKKEDLQSVDLSLRYANTVLDQVVQKEIAEVKESLEAAKQDLIEELSENSDKIIQIKDSPSEFQFKLQPESIPNDLPFLYKAPSLDHDQRLSQSSLTDSPIAKPRKTITEIVKTQDDSFDDNEEEDDEAEEEDYEEDEEENDYEESEKSSKIIDKSLPVPASRSSSDPEKDKESSSSLSVPPKPAPRRRHKPSRGGKKLNIEIEGGGSSSESSNYQSCDYEIGSGSRPSSSDIEALHSAAGVLSCTASEYETALMSIEHSSASRPTSQDYQSALSTLSSRESMKSLNSFSSGRLGSIDSTSEHTDTLVASEPEMEKDEIDENLELALEDDEEIPRDGSFDKSTDGLPRTMKRSSEMIFEQISEDSGSLPGPLGESMEDDSRGQSTKVPSSIIISEDDDQKTSTIDAFSDGGKALDSSSAEIKFKSIEAQSTGDDIDPSELKMSSLSTIDDTDALLLTKRSVLQQASMSTSSTSGMSIETIVEREKLDRNSPDSDSFELVDKPDIIDDFVVIEEVGKEAEEFDSEGKSISITTIPTSSIKKYDRDLENLITDKKDDEEKILQIKKSRNNDLFDFESEESPPQVSNDEQYSQSLSDEESDHKKWMEMQFQEQRNYELEYDRGPLEDIKEEEITDFEAGSSRFGSLGSHKGSISSSGSMKGSYGNDYDVLAGKKQFSKSIEHDNISMNSLQEFENIEYSVGGDNLRKLQPCGSQDSVNNGSLPRRYLTSRSGHGGSGGDDVISVSSLKDFEGLEQACREAHMIELRAKEEEDLLDHESPENRYRLENLTKSKIINDTISTNITTTFNPSTSGSDDYEKRIMEIDEIIRIAQANVEKFDRQDDTTEDISQIEITDIDKIEPPSNITLPLESDDSLVKTRDINAMETSTDSLEIEANDDKKNLMCRSSDSLELKTTLDFPSLSYSDSLNNVKDAKEGQCSGEQFNSARRISSDSLEIPTMEDSGNDDGSNRQTKSASSTEVAVKKNGKTVYSHTTDA